MGGKNPRKVGDSNYLGGWGQVSGNNYSDASKFSNAGGTEDEYNALTPEQQAQYAELLRPGGQEGHAADNAKVQSFVAGVHGVGHDRPQLAAADATSSDYSTAARPDSNNAWGSQTSTVDPVTGKVTYNTTLAPGMGNANHSLEQQYAEALNHPLSGEQARKEAINASYNQSTARLDPQWDKRQEALRTQLLNQGLDPSSQAGMSAMRESNLARNDAYSSAMNAAQLQGDSAGNSLFNNQLAARNNPLQQMQLMKQLAQSGDHPELLSALIAQKNNALGLAGQAQQRETDLTNGAFQLAGSALNSI